MITYGNDKTYKLYCLSTDEKPELSEESNGSVLLEIDTGKKYMYDGKEKEWLLISNSLTEVTGLTSL